MTESEPSDLQATEKLLADTLGGARGLIDSALPTVAFLAAFTFSGQDLSIATIAAGIAALALMMLRLFRRQPLQQILSGLVGVAIAIWFTRSTGKAENFFLPGLLTNAAYAFGIAVSIAIRHPFLGYVVGALQGNLLDWRSAPANIRFFQLISWWWVGMFSLRLLIQLPLYLSSQLELLGTAKLIMGWPLYLAVVWVTYRAVKARSATPSSN